MATFLLPIVKKEIFKYLFPSRANYLNPVDLIAVDNKYEDASRTLYLGRLSFVTVTAHKQTTYMPLDTVQIDIYGAAGTQLGQVSHQSILLRDKAEAPDKTFNLQTVYGHTIGSFIFGSTKLQFIKKIIRSGSIISTQFDSTDVIQFGTKNFTLNY